MRYTALCQRTLICSGTVVDQVVVRGKQAANSAISHLVTDHNLCKGDPIEETDD